MIRIRAVAAVTFCCLCAVLLAGSPAGAVTIAPDSPGCVVAPAPKVGISEVSRTQTADRVLELTLHSAAMQGDQHVNVLLPKGYDPSGRTRYPVLYLLHGAFGNYQDWLSKGDAEAIIGDRQLIVVMPDDGQDGSYSDWYGTLAGTSEPPPAWESYHTRELVPFVDAHFPTVASRQDRFVAGLSSGGGGAMKYAAADAGMFGAAGEFSGAVDTDLDYPQYPTISEVLWGITDIPGYGPDGHCTWGDPYTQRVVWLDNTATYLAENLGGTALYLTSGNGDPGPYDASSASWDPVEYEVGQMNEEFVKALDAAGVPHTDDFYGAGTHTWPYWQRDLQRFLVWLDQLVAHPPAPPDSFSYRSARPTFDAWDWRFTAHRDVREFVYLNDVSAGGLGVTGSGGLDVITAPIYRPGRPYLVTADGGPRPVNADASGRLHFTLDLGPSHETQQYDFGADEIGSWRHLQVRIERAAGR